MLWWIPSHSSRINKDFLMKLVNELNEFRAWPETSCGVSENGNSDIFIPADVYFEICCDVTCFYPRWRTNFLLNSCFSCWLHSPATCTRVSFCTLFINSNLLLNLFALLEIVNLFRCFNLQTFAALTIVLNGNGCLLYSFLEIGNLLWILKPKLLDAKRWRRSSRNHQGTFQRSDSCETFLHIKRK